MKLPGLAGYGDRLAEHYVNYKARCRQEREEERERTAPGPVFSYTPYAGVYRLFNEGGAFMGYWNRDEYGNWTKAEPVALLQEV